MTEHAEHLRLLSIFHFVVAGIAAIFSLLPVIHLVMGIAMVRGWLPGAKEEPPLEVFGWILIGFASAAILCGLTFATCLAMAGRCLARRRRYGFCLVMAAVACIFMPFGTVLGVLTIVVLTKPSVRGLFPDAKAAPAQA